jgi:uncharacterized protein YndB with AHSA1/START domain
MASFTPADHLGAVSRALATTTRNGEEMRQLTVSRTYDAPPDEVWDALTNAERIPRWLLPITGDLRVGGRFQLEGQAGGEILACAPPELLQITWEYGGGMSWVDATLSPEGDGSRLELVHTAPVPPEMWEQFGPSAVGLGWELMLMGVAEHLADPGFTPPPPGVVDEDHVDYMTTSSAAWGAEDAASGTDPAQAAAAAERCLAAYTGQESG